MEKFHRCPKCGGIKFLVTAHVTQTWEVDAKGNFVSEASSCDDIMHRPNDDDIWTCANDECNWCGAGKDAISDNSKESRKEEDREQALMTVCEVAKHNTESVLDMMTPAGFLRIPAQQLLTANTVQTNPGCSGCFMPIEAKTILDMKVLSLNVKKDAIYMMTE